MTKEWELTNKEMYMNTLTNKKSQTTSESTKQ
jgi:hypothetical protein